VNAYANKDKYDSFRDSVWTTLAQAARMQDTTIILDPSFRVVDIYYVRDRQTAIQDSIARPSLMQDTTVVRDSVFVVSDRYALKDSLDAIRDSLTAIADSLYTDSVNRHWAGWNKFEMDPGHVYTLNSQKVLKGKSKTALQYNIADFYLYLNGDRVRPTGTENEFLQPVA
jgi:hypothetical protein